MAKLTICSAASYDHDREVGAEQLLGERIELAQHAVAEAPLGAGRLHRLDALDGVDLVRVVLAERLLEASRTSGAAALREAHQQRVGGRRGEEHQREHQS